MNVILMPFGFLISLLLGLVVFIVTASFDRRALEQAQQDRLELSLNVKDLVDLATTIGTSEYKRSSM